MTDRNAKSKQNSTIRKQFKQANLNSDLTGVAHLSRAKTLDQPRRNTTNKVAKREKHKRMDKVTAEVERQLNDILKIENAHAKYNLHNLKSSKIAL